jgi:hypothetical protein
MTGAILLVTDVMFHDTVVVITTALTAAVFAAVWFVAPLIRRTRTTPE